MFYWPILAVFGGRAGVSIKAAEAPCLQGLSFTHIVAKIGENRSG